MIKGGESLFFLYEDEFYESPNAFSTNLQAQPKLNHVLH